MFRLAAVTSSQLFPRLSSSFMVSAVGTLLLTATLVGLPSIALADTYIANTLTETQSTILAQPAKDLYCHKLSDTQTTRSKHLSQQQLMLNCMMTELNHYQEDNRSARQRYLAYKAQAWLNYAYHLDSINSRSIAGAQALQAGKNILHALKQGHEDQLSLITDIPSTSALMRPDLWAVISALKDSGGIATAPRELAYSEIALIWAAMNQCEQGMQQSSAHFRMADRWLEQAREAYVNAHDSATNVRLEMLINTYYKQYAPLDPSDDTCSGQLLSKPVSTLNKPSQKLANTIEVMPYNYPTPIYMPTPTATYSIAY